MKNITLKIDDDTYRKARIRAAHEGTSVSAMVREFLVREASDAANDSHQRIVSQLKKIYIDADARSTPRTESLIPLTREEIYADRIR